MAATLATKRVWRPQNKQALFLPRTEDEVLYGGAAFGGKSEALLMFSIRRREKYPHSGGLILRRTYEDLKKEGALIPRSLEILVGRAAWNGTDHKWTFPNGSVIQFGYLQHSDQKYNYQGNIWEDICWDELTQFPFEADYQYVNAFCRTDIQGCKPLVRAACNPGGPGHGWVKARYIDIAPPMQAYTDPTTGKSRCFIPATLDDNQIGLSRDPSYERRLRDLPEQMYKALRMGNWDVFEGMVFREWDRFVHVCDPFPIPDSWTRWVAIDYGYVSPFAALWFAKSPKECACYGETHDHVYIYREMYQSGLRAQEQARRIKFASKGERIRMYAADPSMWQKREGVQGDNLAQEYQQEGITLTKANNDRMAGLNAFHEMLGVRRGINDQIESVPRLKVFSTCTNFIRTVPQLPHDPHRVEDVDCFIAGTSVSTPDGDRPIESLRVGDLVDTPIGPQPVIKDGISGWASTVTVPLSNGQELTGTLDHKVYVRGKGLTPLAELRQGDILMPKTIAEESICRIRNRNTAMLGVSSALQRVRTFIIRTAIPLTTIRPIWKFSTLRLTPESLSPSGMPIPSNESGCIAGITALRVGKSYERTPEKCKSEPLNENLRADIVARLLGHDTRARPSVPRCAPTKRVSLASLSVLVRFAAYRFRRLMPKPQPVRIVAAGNYAGVQRVYNLTVAHAHLYFANGVLVTNTDAEDHLFDAGKYGILALDGVWETIPILQTRPYTLSGSTNGNGQKRGWA